MFIAPMDRDQRERTDGLLVVTTGVAGDGPRAFAQWLDTNRPTPVSAQHKARMLSMLPAEGEVINLDESVRRKLAGLSRSLQRTERDSVYEIKVTDVPFARVADS